MRVTPTPYSLQPSKPETCKANLKLSYAAQNRLLPAAALIAIVFGKRPDPMRLALKPLWTAPAVETELAKQSASVKSFSENSPKRERLAHVFAMLDALPKASSPLEAWVQLNQVLQLQEDAVYGNAFHNNRMYIASPRTFFVGRNIDAQLLICRNRKNLIFFAPNGAYEIWRRNPEEAFDLSEHAITHRVYVRAGADGRHVSDYARLWAGQLIKLEKEEATTPWDHQNTVFEKIRMFIKTFYPPVNTGEISNLKLVEQTSFHKHFELDDFKTMQTFLHLFPLPSDQLASVSLVVEMLDRIYAATGAYKSLLNPELRPTNMLYQLGKDTIALYSPLVPALFLFEADGTLQMWVNNHFLKTGDIVTDKAPKELNQRIELDLHNYTHWLTREPVKNPPK